MEREIREALNNAGHYPMTGKDFCVLSTVPDFFFPRVVNGLAVYLDGAEAHRKREERDQEIRELLTKRYNIRVLPIPYEKYSKAEKERIFKEILEAIE